MKREVKHDDGLYHINGKKYPLLVGSRAQVWHRTAFKTSGGLKHASLKQNSDGRIVSKVKSILGKTQKHLGAHLQKKGSGTFGSNKNTKSNSKTMKQRKGVKK